MKFIDFLAPFKILAIYTAGILTALSLSRIGLSLWQHERLLNQSDWYLTLLQGVRVDVATLGWMFALPSLALFLFSPASRLGRVVWRGMQIYMFVMLVLLCYLELVTPAFMQEYNLRPNRLFIEYLVYPREVISMLIEGYKVTIFMVILGLMAVTKLGWLLVSSLAVPTQHIGIVHRAALTVTLVLFCLLAARSTLGHRPLNPAMVAYANDPLVNDLSLNSTYSLMFAAKNMSAEKNAEKFYGGMPGEQIVQVIRESSGLSGDMIDESAPTLHLFEASHHPDEPINLVILLQESLGARFVGGLGGKDLTPELDKLMQEGWSFSRFYATGTRSVRGIEAVLTGFSPSPSRAVVKLSKSQTDFFTIADLLKRQGYHTQFIYGGEAHFDNMKSFLLGNGVDDIVDISRITDPEFTGSWGVSDGDLYNQAHKEFSALAAQDKPFFSLVFTSTNHTPFEYPPGHIVPKGDVQSRENAIRYSDWALGEFFEKAKSSDYWDNTLFWVLADHDARIYESSILPIRSFHIPSVILGGHVQHKNDDRLASSMDVVPTLLSLAGVSCMHPAIGNDLTQPLTEQQLHARMQFDKNFGYVKNNKLIVMQPEKPVIAYGIEGNVLLDEVELTEQDRVEAKANALWANYAYQNNMYHQTDTCSM